MSYFRVFLDFEYVKGHMFKITEKNRKWWIFVAMSGALSVVFLDQTAISVILPPIQKDLGLSNVLLQWVINAYLLSLAALVIFGGKLGDVLGHKRTFLAGIIIFVLASISCAAAQTSYWLVTSRIIQGVGGAFMIPVTSVMMAHAFLESERGKVMGLYVAVASVFLSLGPLLSGLLAHYFNWRWVLDKCSDFFTQHFSNHYCCSCAGKSAGYLKAFGLAGIPYF
ncbi:MFS transporter [Coxiella burnetii]|nr:MFS transporter [Coxiella burnetii]